MTRIEVIIDEWLIGLGVAVIGFRSNGGVSFQGPRRAGPACACACPASASAFGPASVSFARGRPGADLACLVRDPIGPPGPIMPGRLDGKTGAATGMGRIPRPWSAVGRPSTAAGGRHQLGRYVEFQVLLEGLDQAEVLRFQVLDLRRVLVDQAVGVCVESFHGLVIGREVLIAALGRLVERGSV